MLLNPRPSKNPMATKTPVVADKGLQSPLLSQAIKCGGMIYVSGNIGIVPETMSLVEGSVSDRTVKEAPSSNLLRPVSDDHYHTSYNTALTLGNPHPSSAKP